MKSDVTESIMRNAFSRFILLFSVVSTFFGKSLTESGGSVGSGGSEFSCHTVRGHLCSGTVLQ